MPRARRVRSISVTGAHAGGLQDAEPPQRGVLPRPRRQLPGMPLLLPRHRQRGRKLVREPRAVRATRRRHHSLRSLEGGILVASELRLRGFRGGRRLLPMCTVRSRGQSRLRAGLHPELPPWRRAGYVQRTDGQGSNGTRRDDAVRRRRTAASRLEGGSGDSDTDRSPEGLRPCQSVPLGLC